MVGLGSAICAGIDRSLHTSGPHLAPSTTRLQGSTSATVEERQTEFRVTSVFVDDDYSDDGLTGNEEFEGLAYGRDYDHDFGVHQDDDDRRQAQIEQMEPWEQDWERDC